MLVSEVCHAFGQTKGCCHGAGAQNSYRHCGKPVHRLFRGPASGVMHARCEEHYGLDNDYRQAIEWYTEDEFQDFVRAQEDTGF